MIEWKVSYDTAERYWQLSQELETYEIDQEEFANKVAELPGYPLARPLQNGDNLHLVLPIRTTVAVPPSKKYAKEGPKNRASRRAAAAKRK
jgi:hypothetical protein